jgi:hypothetical protein
VKQKQKYSAVDDGRRARARRVNALSPCGAWAESQAEAEAGAAGWDGHLLQCPRRHQRSTLAPHVGLVARGRHEPRVSRPRGTELAEQLGQRGGHAIDGAVVARRCRLVVVDGPSHVADVDDLGDGPAQVGRPRVHVGAGHEPDAGVGEVEPEDARAAELVGDVAAAGLEAPHQLGDRGLGGGRGVADDHGVDSSRPLLLPWRHDRQDRAHVRLRGLGLGRLVRQELQCEEAEP